MRPLNRHLMSVADYLHSEETSPFKREYVGGFVYPLHGRTRATAGTTAAHNQIGVNFVMALYDAAKQAGGWVYSFDLKLHITHNDIFFYPDVMVVRGEMGDPDATYVTDPCLLVEIISKRSVLVDRHAKYAAYTAIPSLQTYLIVEQDKRLVYAYQRGPAGWSSSELHGQGDIGEPGSGLPESGPLKLHSRRLMLFGPNELGWQTELLRVPGPGEVLVQTLLSAVSVASELSLVVRNVPTELPRKLGYQTLGRTAGGRRFVSTAGHVSAAVLGERHLIPVPDHVPDSVALAVILGEETHKGIRKLSPQPGERVLIAGAGLLGLLTLFNLTRRGVRNVTVIEPQPERRALAELFGAAAVAAPGELTEGAFDLGFECSAAQAGFTELLERLRPAGRACVLSDGNWGTLSLPPAFHTRELSVVASSDGEDYQEYACWLWANAEPLLSRLFEVRVPAEQLPYAFDKLQTWPRPVSLVAEWEH